MTQGTGGARLPYKKLEAPPPPPLITILLAISGVISVCGRASMPDKITWINDNCFTAAKMSDLLHSSNFPGLLSLMFGTANTQLSIVIWLANAFFIWCFGYVVERQLKGLRYLVLVGTLFISGWVLVFVNAGFNIDKLYVGPSMMLFGLLGAYFAFFPKKPFEPRQWLKPSNQIFERNTEKPMHETGWVSPWVYVTAFVIYEVFLQAGLTFGGDAIASQLHMDSVKPLYDFIFGKMQVSPEAFQPIAAVMNIGVGFMLASMLPKLAPTARARRPGGKLQLEVVQHYRELRTLDMTHEQACEGAARFASVPIDVAKDWISKGAAGLKDQDLR